MLKNPENYEEARKIIENAVDDELQTKRMKIAKLRWFIALGVGTVASVIIGVKTDDLVLGVIAFANVLILTSPFTIPILRRKAVTDAVHDGSYFDEVPEDKVMYAATDYVREYNLYEKKKKRSGK